EEERVVPRQDGVLHLRNDGVVVAEDAVEDRLPRLELADEVAPHLLLDADDLVTAGFELAEGAWSGHALAFRGGGSGCAFRRAAVTWTRHRLAGQAGGLPHGIL